jgi:hypothetical protein
MAYSKPLLENINFDTGKKTVPNDYKEADETDKTLLEKQRKSNKALTTEPKI